MGVPCRGSISRRYYPNPNPNPNSNPNQGLNLETLLTSGESSFPVRVLCSWLQTARLVHGLDEVREADAAAAEAAAQAAAVAAAEAKSMAEVAKAAAEAEVAVAEATAAEATAADERAEAEAEAVAMATAAAAGAAKPTHVALRAILARQATQMPALPRQLGKQASTH